MISLDAYMANTGIFLVVIIIVVTLLGLTQLLLTYRKELYKNKVIRNLFLKKKSVWAQRVFITATLVMLFFNFFSAGYSITPATTTQSPTPVVQARVSSSGNNNAVLYKGVYAQIVQNLQTNEQQYLTNFKDIESSE